jgi:hypothetical protein
MAQTMREERHDENQNYRRRTLYCHARHARHGLHDWKAVAAFDAIIAANNAATRVEDIKFIDSMGASKIADRNQKTLNENRELDARSRAAVQEHLAAALADTCQEDAR